MTGTYRLLTLTATAVIALGAAAGPSLAAKDRGLTQSRVQELVKQAKQQKAAKKARHSNSMKQGKHAGRGKAKLPAMQALRGQAPKNVRSGERGKHRKQAGFAAPAMQALLGQRSKGARSGDRGKHRQHAGFTTPPTRVKPPKANVPNFAKPPKHGKRPSSERHDRTKHAVYTPPRPVVMPGFDHKRTDKRDHGSHKYAGRRDDAPRRPMVMPDYGYKREKSHGYDSHKRAGHGGYAPRRPVVMPDYGYKREKSHGHKSHKHAGHGGYAPPRPVVLPKRHYHKHREKVVVHHHYQEYRSHSHNHDDGSYLLPFLALGVTAAVLASQADYGTQPAYPAYQEEVTFNTPRYPVTEPVTQPVAYAPPVEPTGPAATCVMTREYQTQITVGGQLVPAYGQACLQPDGSWYHGPAVPEPY